MFGVSPTIFLGALYDVLVRKRLVEVEWGRKPNNGIHPTANSVALIRKTWRTGVECAAGDAGRSTASHSLLRPRRAATRPTEGELS